MRSLSGGRAVHERASLRQGRQARAEGAGPTASARSRAAAAVGAAASSKPVPFRRQDDGSWLPDEGSWLQDPINVRGLRSVSVRMCHLLRQKQTCTCNEVADQLTEESQAATTRERADAKSDSDSPVPEKNLRRRIYDALNVLASAGVVEKDGEVVHWRGLPDHIEVSALQAEKRQLQLRIANKKRLAAEIQEKRAAFEVLLKRNRDPEFSRHSDKDARLAMPFVSIVASNHTTIKRVETTQHTDAEDLPNAGAPSGDATTATAETVSAANSTHSTPQRGTRRTTRSASAPPSSALQSQVPSGLTAAATSATRATPRVVYEISDKFRLQDDADVLKQMIRAGTLKRRRLVVGSGPDVFAQ